jgi:hypothetical protein
MAKTKLVSVAASPTKTPIITQRASRTVIIGEDPSVAGYPTTDYSVMAPTQADDAVRFLAGTKVVFECPRAFWPAGQVIAYVTPITGSTTFQQIEDGV